MIEKSFTWFQKVVTDRNKLCTRPFLFRICESYRIVKKSGWLYLGRWIIYNIFRTRKVNSSIWQYLILGPSISSLRYFHFSDYLIRVTAQWFTHALHVTNLGFKPLHFQVGRGKMHVWNPGKLPMFMWHPKSVQSPLSASSTNVP